MEPRAQDGAMALEISGGAVIVTRVAPTVLSVSLRGEVGLALLQAATAHLQELLPSDGSRFNIYQDVTGATHFAMDALLHFSEWARDNASRIARLSFAIDPASPLLATIRAVVMALPIRAYMYRDSQALSAAMHRAKQESVAR